MVPESRGGGGGEHFDREEASSGRGKLNTSFTAKIDSAADQMKVARRPIEMWTLEEGSNERNLTHTELFQVGERREEKSLEQHMLDKCNSYIQFNWH